MVIFSKVNYTAQNDSISCVFAILWPKQHHFDFVLEVFDVMQRANWHTFQVLTKRAERLEELSPRIDWPENVWMGVSVEN